ncbi:MAG: hypothetical protein EBU57_10645 [Alphaproteobacteria bacterium]|nr:hypothetical protein [Alphaproteobacteria bacterium]
MEAFHDLFALVFLQVGEGRIEKHHTEHATSDIEITAVGFEIIGEQGKATAHDELGVEEIRKFLQKFDDFGRVFTDF